MKTNKKIISLVDSLIRQYKIDSTYREIYYEFIETVLQKYYGLNQEEEEEEEENEEEEDNNIISFKADSLPTTGAMAYADAETMVSHLALQLKVLEASGGSLLYWQAADILCITTNGLCKNTKIYLLADLTQFVPLYKKNPAHLVLNYPVEFPTFTSLTSYKNVSATVPVPVPAPVPVCAPELLCMKAIPFITPKSCSYYSLALLVLAKLNLSLDALQGTKLFYFLERCLKTDPLERYCCVLF
jgi:hypothetical protein